MLRLCSTIYLVTLAVFFLPVEAAIWHKEQFHMIASYFESTGVQSLNVYACSIQEAYDLTKFLMKRPEITVQTHAVGGWKTLKTPSASNVQGIIMDFDCYIDNMEWTNGMFNTSYKWLILVDHWDDIDTLADTNLNMLSDVVVTNCTYNECKLLEAFRIRASHPLNFLELGCWENSTLTLGNKMKRNNLHGIEIIGGLKIGYYGNCTGIPPYFEDRSRYPGDDIFTRFHLVLFRHLEVLFNYKLTGVRSRTFGYPLQNGSYDGLIGDILSNKIDFGVTTIEPRPGRADRVDFLVSLWKIRMIFMLRQPRALGSFSALAQPLSSQVWAGILVLAILFSVCFDIMQHFSLENEKRASYLEGFVLVVGALSQQGLSNEVYKTSTRMLSFFLLLLCLILMTYYNAAIMNSLLSPAPALIRNLDQLIAPTSPVQPGLLNITYLVDNRSAYLYVRPNTAKAVQRTSNPIMELKQGIKRVKDSNFAFCAEDIILFEEVQRTFDDAQKCDLSYIELLKPFGISSPIGKSSPFKEILMRGLLYLQENGLVDREKKHWRPSTPQCFGSISYFNVSLRAVGLSYAIFLGGVISSIIIFINEYWCKSNGLFLMK